jgi:hypothetical protein
VRCNISNDQDIAFYAYLLLLQHQKQLQQRRQQLQSLYHCITATVPAQVKRRQLLSSSSSSSYMYEVDRDERLLQCHDKPFDGSTDGRWAFDSRRYVAMFTVLNMPS